jgi:hypothetical protein
MILNAFTAFHVVLSLVGIGSGLFPFHRVTPAQVLGVLSLIALIIAGLSIYRHHLQGICHRTYAITAVMALYFNVCVLVVQALSPGFDTERHGADPVGAAFPDSAARRAAAVRGDGIRAATAKPQRGLVP